MSKTRKLAAIMFTDIQGYTAMMQQDEEVAVKTRNRHRLIFETTTEKHQGKILQYYGDGTLSIFDSAVEAVECGIEMQLRFRNDPGIPVRIGIHLGDVIYDEHDVIGDGVNVAARVESLGEAGCVVISGKVNDEIKNHAGISTQSIGHFEFKNVQEPMEVYAVTNPGLVIPKADRTGAKAQKVQSVAQPTWKWAIAVGLFLITALVVLYEFSDTSEFKKWESGETTERSLAVLPFSNMSNDPDQEYFSDGITEEILNSLARIPGLKVPGRTSSFAFKGKNDDLRVIGEKLGVEMVLEGSVRKAGTRVRITAQLINVEDGYHIWSEQYDRELKDIFAVQEEIATNIVNMFRLTVLDLDEGRPATTNVEAYENYLKGVYFLRRDFEGVEKARDYFGRAMDSDPGFAAAVGGKADAFLNLGFYGFIPLKTAYDSAQRLASQAIRLDSQIADPHRVLAYCNLFFNWNWELAKSEYDRAVELGLHHPDHFLNFYDAFLYGNHKKAIQDATLIARRDPLSVEAYWHLGLSNLMGGKAETAIQAFQQCLELNPNYSEGYRWIGKSYTELGRYQEAQTALEKALELTGGQGPAQMEMILMEARLGGPAKASELANELEEGDKQVEPILMTDLYSLAGDLDKTFEWIDVAFEQRSIEILSLKYGGQWDHMRSDPRFQSYVARLNYPEGTNE